jgi:hypothetical protein
VGRRGGAVVEIRGGGTEDLSDVMISSAQKTLVARQAQRRRGREGPQL